MWQPAWGIRLILEALVSFLPSPSDGAIGALDWTSEERKNLAKKSVDYSCPVCGKCSTILLDIEKKLIAKEGTSSGSNKPNKFQKEIEHLHALQNATENAKDDKSSVSVVGRSEDMEHGDVTDNQLNIKTEENLCLAHVDNEERKEEAADNSEPSVVSFIHKDGSDNSAEAVSDARRDVSDEIDPPRHEYIQNENQDRDTLETPILTDPMANLGIIVFSIIVYLMIRKIRALMDDFIELEAQFKK